MATVGTYDISFLLQARNQSAKEFGIGNVVKILQADLSAHNAIVNDMLADLCEFSTDAQRLYGASSAGAMFKVDEFGRAPGQIPSEGGTVAFPLELFQYNLGWTKKYLETASVADLAQRQLDAETAHMKMIQTQIQEATLRKTNYTFRDYLVDNVDLSVKQFVNADSMAIPDGPNGETFTASTHDHYRSTGTAAVADYNDLVDTVVEHGHGGYIKMCINKADQATVAALSGYNAYIDPRISVPGGATAGVPVKRLDITRLDNRPVGLLGEAEVWVKPWIPADYTLVYDAADIRKPLVFRQRAQAGLQGLRLVAEFDTHPLQVQFMEAEFGIAVNTRTNGSVLYVGNDTWADGA
jgi:hypothetical protein